MLFWDGLSSERWTVETEIEHFLLYAVLWNSVQKLYEKYSVKRRNVSVRYLKPTLGSVYLWMYTPWVKGLATKAFFPHCPNNWYCNFIGGPLQIVTAECVPSLSIKNLLFYSPALLKLGGLCTYQSKNSIPLFALTWVSLEHCISELLTTCYWRGFDGACDHLVSTCCSPVSSNSPLSEEARWSCQGFWTWIPRTPKCGFYWVQE